MTDLQDKVVLVTGGTGSFGRSFVRRILDEDGPRVVRIYSRDELKQSEMDQQFSDERVRFLIGDVRDRERLYRAMYGVDVVVHAAALKQVPTLEYNPIEAVKTNILGAINVIDAAIDNGVKQALFLSTDKAVHPVNLYGATKLVAEKLIIQANAYVGGRDTRFSCVRYGNVMGSRGSVIPIFLRGRENGVISITDVRMTRFWISLTQGADFVRGCLGRMVGGEVFVPKIPSMKIVDIARALAPEARCEIIGIRPGEKLHEELITQEEALQTREFDSFYVIDPLQRFWEQEANLMPGGGPVAPDFQYRSDTNDCWLTSQELEQCVAELQTSE